MINTHTRFILILQFGIKPHLILLNLIILLEEMQGIHFLFKKDKVFTRMMSTIIIVLIFIMAQGGGLMIVKYKKIFIESNY